MNCEEASAKAVKLFDEGFHCSQAVLSVVAEMAGEKDDISNVIAAVSPFGGGLASTGNVCGCLAGALASLGLLMGKKEPAAKDDKQMWRLGYKMVRRFEEITSKYESINCSDIAEVNWKDREDVINFRKNVDGRRSRCHQVLSETVASICSILMEYEKKSS